MNHITTKKPWGSFTQFTHNELSTVKLLYISQGEEFSLQHHASRTEFWKILKGNPIVTVGKDSRPAKVEEEFVVEPGMDHRVSAPTDDVVILEISTGEFNEDDIVRIEDKYGRV